MNFHDPEAEILRGGGIDLLEVKSPPRGRGECRHVARRLLLGGHAESEWAKLVVCKQLSAS